VLFLVGTRTRSAPDSPLPIPVNPLISLTDPQGSGLARSYVAFCPFLLSEPRPPTFSRMEGIFRVSLTPRQESPTNRPFLVYSSWEKQ